MEKNNPLVSIIMVVHNGASWLPAVLDSVKQQTYPHFEVLIRDNASTDATAQLAAGYRVFPDDENAGAWAGFERTLAHAQGGYVLFLTDVILEPTFLANAVAAMERDPSIGALQAKVLQSNGMIDSTGFAISRSRRITNRGQGESDHGQYDRPGQIFAVEGAAPFFRSIALRECTVNGWLVDPDYRVGPLGYGDDLDVAWRMHLFGWTQWYDPSVIGRHDRSTTTTVARGAGDYLIHRSQRQAIPLLKRRLDWSNVRFTIIKNDFIVNVLRDLPIIVAREIAVFAYTLLFEPRAFKEIGRFLRLLPRMIGRRRQIMARAEVTPAHMRAFLT